MPVTDDELWNRYVENVTPLGDPKPSRPEIAVVRVIASREIDLHGLSMAEAHSFTMDFLEGASGSVTVVTGISGAIRREFPQWFDHLPHIRLEELNGGGAYRIHIRRKRKK